MNEAVLVSNGPGELYTWVQPVLAALREKQPQTRVSLSLIPCQFASGNEARIAAAFGADTVTTPADYLRYVTTGQKPVGLGAKTGFVLSLGGNTNMALKLGKQLGYPTYRYSFVPYWHPKLRKLYVHDENALRKARLLGAPKGRVEVIGNLVADAVELAQPAANPGRPHILLIPGSRDGFARYVIPFMIAMTDALGAHYPEARFVWPVSRLLKEETIAAGISGQERAVLGGVAGVRDGRCVITPGGRRLELLDESDRYSHMRRADLAITIPGTNTLELGIANVPSVVILPLNKPEGIPLEGIGHWLSLIPLIGIPLKRQAVKLAAPHLPVSLPNHLTGEDLMLEIKGKVTVEEVAEAARGLLENKADYARRKERLAARMPSRGAAAALVESILRDLEEG